MQDVSLSKILKKIKINDRVMIKSRLEDRLCVIRSYILKRQSDIRFANKDNHISDILFRDEKKQYRGRLIKPRKMTPLEFYVKRLSMTFY